MKYRTDYRQLLDPKIITKISSLDLRARYIVEGFLIGLHRSPYHGFSVEFSEHRPYLPGDEISRIDWKVYGKTDRFFIKQYEEETNLKCYVLVDCSKSMEFTSKGITKFQYAITLAAAISYLLFDQKDAVGLVLYSDKIQKIIEPRASKINLFEIYKSLINASTEGKTETAGCLGQVAEKIKKRGLIVVISDFLDDLNKIESAMKKFRFKQNEVVSFQILDEQEINFAFSRDAIFKDLESQEELLTQPFQIKASYNELVKEFINSLKRRLLNHQIDHNLIITNEPFDKALLAFLKKRKRLH
ncbi:MAG: DUF58 domain-containing protein [Ignavibacteria bacterium]|nr:DUF58 domain-containing protein [Ignavibacteria bacterium]